MEYEAMDPETVAGLLGENGISTRQLRNYCNLGCPYEERGRQRVFSWHKVLAWYVAFKNGGIATGDLPEPALDDTPARNENQAQANLRKTKAEADLKQLALAKVRRQVIETDEARILLDRMFGNLRTQLLGLPAKCIARLAGERDPNAQEGLLKEEVEMILRDLATAKIVRDAMEETSDEQEDTTDEVADLEASAEDISDEEVNRIVVEFLAANAALQEAEARA